MKKLHDIPRKEIFATPEKYFEKLPAIIHSRIHQTEAYKENKFLHAPWYAVPVAVLLFGMVWFYSSQPSEGDRSDVEALLSAIPEEDLIVYLDETDAITEPVADPMLMELPEHGDSELDVNENTINNLLYEIYRKDTI